MYFTGDIIITDPCYFIKDEDWERTGCGQNLEEVGFSNNYIVESTIYGDWGCTTYSTDKDPRFVIDQLCKADKWYDSQEEETPEIEEEYLAELQRIERGNKEIGHFCADSGQVGVFLLEDILRYNPNFEIPNENGYLATLVKDFKGDVEYYVDDEDQAHILGRGITNFYSVQTSL